MPLDDDYDDLPEKNKSGLKNISSQKSIFDNAPKKQSQEDFNKVVRDAQEKGASFKSRTADLAIQFRKIIEDKTLPQNKSIFASEIEREVLSSIIKLASEINNDPNESEGIGSLSWIAQLFKITLLQRDRLNKIEYSLMQLDKKLENCSTRDFVNLEISKVLDMKKNSE